VRGVNDPLLDAPPEKGFWFCNSSRANNIYQLVDTIEHTNEGVFRYHVNKERNDFADWILHVLEDEVLYHQVVHETDRYWLIQKVRHRIKELEESAQAAAAR
jgi:hypothetical protein